jgi:TPR repeat protein
MRWLSLAAEKGHVPAQAVLGRMLFMGEAMPRQPARGLMWLRVASENASPGRHAWVIEMHKKANDAASEEERRRAEAQAERYLKSAERR